MSFSEQYFAETTEIIRLISPNAVEAMVDLLASVRERGGRLFILGVGGSAANASHSVNDFRKLCGFEAYAPTDNVAELTARTNDEGWRSVFAGWLKISRLSRYDCVLVLSVGGGDEENNVSTNLIDALDLASQVGCTITGIVGRGGYTARVADLCLIVPTVTPDRVTPHTESFQSLLCHLLVSHPKLQRSPARW